MAPENRAASPAPNPINYIQLLNNFSTFSTENVLGLGNVLPASRTLARG